MADPKKENAEPQVKVFTTTWCGFCKMAKSYLESKKVAYTEVNIEEEPDAAMWLEQQGLRGVPVILFGGKDVVHGFDRPQIDLLIREHKLS